MNQTNIGRFIAAMRKEQALTQRQLADILNISDKTISKWETGKGMPEVSLMLLLCDALHITVNELLHGERLADSDYKTKAEEVIMDLIKERTESKKKLILGGIVAAITILAGCTLVMVSGLLEMDTWIRIVLIVIALVVMAGGIGVAAALEMGAGTFECRHCHTRFVPTAGEYIAGAHSITTRWLKCPECGKKSFCKKRLTH